MIKIFDGFDRGNSKKKKKKKKKKSSTTLLFPRYKKGSGILTHTVALRVKFSADVILKYLSYFSLKTGFDISCKLSPHAHLLNKTYAMCIMLT